MVTPETVTGRHSAGREQSNSNLWLLLSVVQCSVGSEQSRSAEVYKFALASCEHGSGTEEIQTEGQSTEKFICK